MNRNTVIKVSLGCPHLDSDTEPLQHLVTASSSHVEPHHPLLPTLTHQLHHGLRLPAGHGVVERGELGLVHSD